MADDELPLAGREIERLSWPALHLWFSGGPEHALWIEGAFSLRSGEKILVGHPRKPAKWWFRLVGRTVRSASKSADGRSVTLAFTDGSVLEVYPRGSFETWHLWTDDDEADFG